MTDLLFVLIILIGYLACLLVLRALGGPTRTDAR
ncbi:hypothetical protein J2S58_002802 [Nakamurella flavida]|nr:hypothetical protein [Nakamurella flavida]